MRINRGCLVELALKIYALEADGEETLVDETQPNAPVPFIYGMNMFFPRVEEELAGKEVGTKFNLTLEAKDAFGEYAETEVFPIERSIFEIDGQFDSERVVEGALLPMHTSEGDIIEGVVLQVDEQHVLMDFNHPLAGTTIRLEGEVVTVREATEEDYSQFFGQGGGCDCGCHHDHHSHRCGEDCHCH